MTSTNTQQGSPVLKIAVLFLSLAWLLLQILWTITPIYDLPPILFRGVAFMFVMGFPFILMMAWVYGIVHGYSKPGQGEVSEQNEGFGKVFRAVIIVLLSLATLLLLADIFVLKNADDSVISGGSEPVVAQ